jgi:hypothetical protein
MPADLQQLLDDLADLLLLYDRGAVPSTSPAASPAAAAPSADSATRAVALPLPPCATSDADVCAAHGPSVAATSPPELEPTSFDVVLTGSALGIKLGSVNGRLLVVAVEAGSAAEAAGVHQSDEIALVNGEALSLVLHVAEKQLAAATTVRVRRKRTEHDSANQCLPAPRKTSKCCSCFCRRERDFSS